MKNLFTILFLFLTYSIFSQNIKIVNGPYIQNVSDTEATVIWTTNMEAVSWVEVATSDNDSFYANEREKIFQTVDGSRILSKLHRVTIKRLHPGSEYRYRIFSKEVLRYEGQRILYGNIASTDVYSEKMHSFKTLDFDKTHISFRVMNDLHGNNENLEKMAQGIRKENTDFVIFNGDMISSINDEEEIFSGFMDTAIRLFASEIPILFARGNHETRGKKRAKLIDYFPTNNGHYYFTFRYGPIFFLFLDGGEDKPDSDIEYSGLAQFDAYRSEEKEWLEKVIHENAFTSAPYRVVVMHMPPVESTWHGTKDIINKFLPILNAANIDLMLSGHTHYYKYIPRNNEFGINFPVLINDNETYLDIEADNKKISIDVRDTTGKSIQKHFIEQIKKD